MNCFSDDYHQYEALHVQYQMKGESDQVVHVPKEDDPTEMEEFRISRTKDAFFFREGGVVCWGMDPHEERNWLDSIRKHAQGVLVDRPTIEEVRDGLSSFIHTF